MKTVVITGASRGIGLATTKKFLAEGWRVLGTYKDGVIPIEDTRLSALRLDVTSSEDILKTVEEIKQLSLPIDVLVNNAGVNLDGHDMTADVWKIRKTLDVNLLGVIELTEQLLPYMSSGSQIVNVDSLYGAMSTPIDDETSTGYRISKAALNMYTRTLAFRLKPQNILVSSIDPGWCKTDMGNAVASETERPEREPEQAAGDIYQLATTNTESGFFWRAGKKAEW